MVIDVVDLQCSARISAIESVIGGTICNILLPQLCIYTTAIAGLRDAVHIFWRLETRSPVVYETTDNLELIYPEINHTALGAIDDCLVPLCPTKEFSLLGLTAS